MPKQKIIHVKRSDFEPDPGSTWSGWGIWYEGEQNEGDKVDENPALTLEDVADFCDQNAESRNNHSYVGTHRILAAVLHRKVGRNLATQLLIEIAEYGGLDGMSGCGGEASAFEEFSIKDCWADWTLPA